jgi:hypothetical protein
VVSTGYIASTYSTSEVVSTSGQMLSMSISLSACCGSALRPVTALLKRISAIAADESAVSAKSSELAEGVRYGETGELEKDDGWGEW